MTQPHAGPQSTRDMVMLRVSERARHTTAEDVQVTCSFARAERLLASEYHGRFLIELLQNAADAWRIAAQAGIRSGLRITLDPSGPAMLMANRGEPFPAQVVLDSLGHIGRSTKSEGDAIGHKGIGFKSVLEMTKTPEIYSGLGAGPPDLAVRFDAEAALRQVVESSPDWTRHLAAVDDVRRPIDAIPVLRFPVWVEKPPAIVDELAADGFTTVIRLPFTGDNEERWLGRARAAIADVTDQILLLLGTFDELTVDDRIDGTSTVVSPRWSTTRALPDGTRVEDVEVQRNGDHSSRWWLYRSSTPGSTELSGDTVVGVRLVDDPGPDGALAVAPAMETGSTAPFHLYFPTRIASGLPFLLHGYFEVNAARTGFYEGSAEGNETVLSELSVLTATAVTDLASSDRIDLVSLAERLAAATPPDDPHARSFNANVMRLLDDVSWAPTAAADHLGAHGVRPSQLLLSVDPRLDQELAATFPPAYVHRQTGRELPDARLSSAARTLLRSRQSDDAPDVWDAVRLLMRPGDTSPWPPGAEDAGFGHLLDLVQALETLSRRRCDDLLMELRGDERTRLLPVAVGPGQRSLHPLPNPSDAGSGRPSTLVMGRVRTTGAAPLLPPPALKVAFLPDGLLASEADGDRAKPLGVRPFTVDTVLDRLNALEGHPGSPDVVTFLWNLLARERASDFGTAEAVRLAAAFDPSPWFWCQPNRGEASENDRTKQRRQRLLSNVLLPAQDGSWQPAGALAFGADWANWIEAELAPLDPAMLTRARVYRALELAAPSSAALLATPAQLLTMLPTVSLSVDAPAEHDPGTSVDLAAPSTVAVELDDAARNRERHAFLLRLGVAEAIPVEGHHTRTAAENAARPWKELREKLRPGIDGQPWNFGSHLWSGRQHHRVNIDEDFRLRWPLETADATRRQAINTAVAAGAPLYAQLASASAFCPGCTDSGTSHRSRYRTAPNERLASTLRLQLSALPWMVTSRAGLPSPVGVAPEHVWWAESPPSVSGMQTSPLRFLPLCQAEIGSSVELRQVLDLCDIAHAPAPRLQRLLAELRERLDVKRLPEPGNGGSRQALVGLHRLVYERLAELGEGGTDVLDNVGVLCELDGDLVLRRRDEARHDDGRFATYRRHFASVVPFAVLARDRAQTARQLGLRPFQVTLERRGGDLGQDVTAELGDALADRIPELLAILVHHSLGSQTLDPGSEEFARRFRRLKALKVRHVQDLVLDLQTDHSDTTVTLGEGTSQDVFLDKASSLEPILYHDLDGEDWVSRLRPRLAAPLATVVENPAYTATFQLLLLAETVADRESVLHELGISDDDVTTIKVGLGAVTEEEERSYRRWFAALLAVMNDQPAVTAGLDLGREPLTENLVQRGLTPDAARQLVDLGGGPSVRRQRTGGLDVVEAAGFNLETLDQVLHSLGDDGLQVTAARDMMREWLALHGRRLVALMAPLLDADRAKQAVASWQPPASLAFTLRPSLEQVLEPVMTQLRQLGFDPVVGMLAAASATELARLAGADDVAALDALVAPYFDEDERRRLLGTLAKAWRDEFLLLGLLARCAPGASRATIRAHAEAIQRSLPVAPGAPSALGASLPVVLPDTPGLVAALTVQLVDAITAPPPDRQAVLTLAQEFGLPVAQSPHIESALAAPVVRAARQVRERGGLLREAGTQPAVPTALAAHIPPHRRTPGPRSVAASKVDASQDRRKRALGAEGEAWAIAAVITPLLNMEPESRGSAVRSLADFLVTYWKGTPVDAALAHLSGALAVNADAEDLIGDLVGLLHVSEHADAFGFDMLGWLDPQGGDGPRPVALEVKSSTGGSFLLSSNEWQCARRLHGAGEGEGYAVLVVRRAPGQGVPTQMDLLPDPIALVDAGQLHKDDDGYRLSYQSGRGARTVPGT